jgi:voltage-gated potassium channel Kch
MDTVATIIDGIVTNTSLAATPGPDQVIVTGRGVAIGDLYDAGADVFSRPEPAAQLQLVILAITASTAIDVTLDLREVTCPVGAEITVAAELQDGTGQIVPIDASFRMPLRARDGRERVLLATFTQGVVSLAATLRESGVWRVDQVSINEMLPPEQHMQFGGLTLYVTDN